MPLSYVALSPRVYDTTYGVRQAKRGALELVVTGALSHPNIVQVRWSYGETMAWGVGF